MSVEDEQHLIDAADGENDWFTGVNPDAAFLRRHHSQCLKKLISSLFREDRIRDQEFFQQVVVDRNAGGVSQNGVGREGIIELAPVPVDVNSKGQFFDHLLCELGGVQPDTFPCVFAF